MPPGIHGAYNLYSARRRVQLVFLTRTAAVLAVYARCKQAGAAAAAPRAHCRCMRAQSRVDGAATARWTAPIGPGSRDGRPPRRPAVKLGLVIPIGAAPTAKRASIVAESRIDFGFYIPTQRDAARVRLPPEITSSRGQPVRFAACSSSCPPLLLPPPVSTRCPARRCCARLTDRSALWFRSAASWARVAARAAGGLARPRVAGGWRAYLQPRHPRHLPGLPPSLSTGQALSFPLHLSFPLSGLLGHPLPSLRAVVPAHVPRLQKVSPSRVCEKERDEEVDRGSPLAAAVLLAPFLSSWSACCSSPALHPLVRPAHSPLLFLFRPASMHVAPPFRLGADAASTRRCVAPTSGGLSPFLPLLPWQQALTLRSPVLFLFLLLPRPRARGSNRTTYSLCDPRVYIPSRSLGGPTKFFLSEKAEFAKLLRSTNQVVGAPPGFSEVSLALIPGLRVPVCRPFPSVWLLMGGGGD